MAGEKLRGESMHLRLLLALLFLFAIPASAAYKWTMPDGSVIFSDQPPHPDAEKVTLPTTQTFTAPPIPKPKPQNKTTTEEVPAPPTYISLKISQPAPDQTFHDNTGNISVNVAIDPALNTERGHQIVIELDGIAVATTASMPAVLPNVDRGSHTLRARVIDKEGTTLASSEESSFHLFRVSVNR